jgi:hypothetical protein
MGRPDLHQLNSADSGGRIWRKSAIPEKAAASGIGRSARDLRPPDLPRTEER